MIKCALQFEIYTILNSLQFSNQTKSDVGFWRRGKIGVPGEKPLGREKRTSKLSPLMTLSPGIEPGRDTLVEGERSHHCTNPAPLYIHREAYRGYMLLIHSINKQETINCKKSALKNQT